jgi:hypothetical protein
MSRNFAKLISLSLLFRLSRNKKILFRDHSILDFPWALIHGESLFEFAKIFDKVGCTAVSEYLRKWSKTLSQRCHWYRCAKNRWFHNWIINILANSKSYSKPVYQGPMGSCLMRKTRSRKSRVTRVKAFLNMASNSRRKSTTISPMSMCQWHRCNWKRSFVNPLFLCLSYCIYGI